MRAVIAILLAVVALSLAPTRAAPAPWPPPEAMTLGWLEPSAGALLVRWRQRGDADKVTVLRCFADRPTVCKPYTEIADRIPGLRWAVIPAQPGDAIRLTEWDYVDGAWAQRGEMTPPVVVPPLETRLPIVATAGR